MNAAHIISRLSISLAQYFDEAQASIPPDTLTDWRKFGAPERANARYNTLHAVNGETVLCQVNVDGGYSSHWKNFR